MKKTIDPAPNGLLKEFHLKLVTLPTYFRAKVAEECHWSLPTYYRKMKGKRLGSKTKGKVISLLSNAERDKIVAIFYEVMTEAWNDCQKYSGKRG